MPDTAEDPFVTFDSFMAFPPQGPSDLPSVSTGTSHSGFTPQQQSPYTGNVTDFNAGVAVGGLGSALIGQPFGVLPFGQNVGMDLDQGWNWFGVDAPVMQ